jgi:hypothetical protein
LLGFGRELVARDVNRFDLRLRRQLLPLEAVHSKDRVGPGDVAQLTLQFGRIVRKVLDLIVSQVQAERAARAIGRLTFTAHP